MDAKGRELHVCVCVCVCVRVCLFVCFVRGPRRAFPDPDADTDTVEYSKYRCDYTAKRNQALNEKSYKWIQLTQVTTTPRSPQ